MDSTQTKSLNLEVQEKYKKYINPSLARLMKFSGYDTVEWKGQGVFIYDPEGREFMDCAGGYGVFVAGHSPPKIVAAVKEQLERLPLSAKVFFNKPLADLAELLAKVTPGALQYSFVCNSGTEAVEGALKLARLSSKRTQIIFTDNSFHGKTFGSLSASGRDLYKEPFAPLLPEFVHTPYGDSKALKEAVSEKTAGVILEPIQGEGGVNLPPDDYLPEVRKICDETGALLIMDEVQTGLGRTGKLFACQHWNVVPDIMVLAKALGGGVMPIGAFIGTPKVWECLFPQPLIHTSTFGGNPLACAAAIAAINLILEEDLPAQAAVKGEYLMKKLREVQKKYPEIIAEVRGKGLLIGVEMVQEGYGGSVIFEMSRGGVIGVYTLNKPKVIRFEPPLIITEKQIDRAVEVFEKAVSKTKEMFIKNKR